MDYKITIIYRKDVNNFIKRVSNGSLYHYKLLLIIEMWKRMFKKRIIWNWN